MSNIQAVNDLLTAIHFDRFAEIEARHLPDAVFHSFRGPILRDSVSIADWHTEFLRDYADCNYAEVEYLESGETVAARATINAKGYDWRLFTQRVVEVLRLEGEGIAARRLYAMLPDVELDKPTAAAMTAATSFRGGDPAATRTIVEAFYAALLAGDSEGAMGHLAEKAALIDSVYGVVNGAAAVVDLLAAIPKPAFGMWRVTGALYGPKEALLELAIDPTRPRAAHWLRIADGKVTVLEVYWMLREIGLDPLVRRERHQRPVNLPT